MQMLHETCVEADEIDSLGHMNVRHYIARMERANRQLIDACALPPTTMASCFLRRTDTYARYRQEQFEGATLHTLGGLLDVSEDGLRSFVEIRNAQSQAVAATFIATTALIDRTTRELLPFPATPQLGQIPRMDIPEHAQPRSLDLTVLNTAVTLALLEERIPASEDSGMMSGRRDTTVEADDVDPQGWLKEDIELMFLPFTKLAAASGVPHGPPVFTTDDGKRIGWAVIESRNVTFGLPRLGDRLAYFSADLRLEHKSRLSRRWAFARESGQLLGISDTVGLCIDLDARRAIPWPEELRVQIEAQQHPDLA